jgi:hypothetical protein
VLFTRVRKYQIFHLPASVPLRVENRHGIDDPAALSGRKKTAGGTVV